jgi:acetoin utilization deacetylase AcuC-like enzyme
MKVVFDDIQKLHNPSFFLSSGVAKPNPDQPRRADILLAGAERAGLARVVPDDYGLDVIAAVHTPEYIAFLETIHERWKQIPGASPEVIPNVHPDRRNGSYPQSPVGQAGYHVADTAAPIGAETWRAVKHNAFTATHAARLVMEGEASAYGLCRPPGHHAFHDMAGGFCFLNNSAIAAQYLRQKYDRVAIVDVDLHHGNGTQGIFYRRRDVFTVSLHADPERFYPFFWGHASERGEGDGLGFNLNMPLPLGTGDEGFLAALDKALDRVAAYAPGVIVVALGLDASEADPLAGLKVTTPGFGRIADRIAQLGLPTVIVQEGGYICDPLGDNLTSFLEGFQARHRIA